MAASLSGLTGQKPFGFKRKNGHFYRQWHDICDQGGIARVPPHQAGRHSFATEMIIRQGKDAQTAAKLGGWASTWMLDHYAHPEALEGTVDEVFGTSRTKVKKLASNPEM